VCVYVWCSVTATLAVSTFGVQVRYTSASATDCVMVGDNSLTNCAHSFEWPTENTETSTNGATTTSRTDVQSAEYNKGMGDYTVGEGESEGESECECEGVRVSVCVCECECEVSGKCLLFW
jgi:hypothetical protein